MNIATLFARRKAIQQQTSRPIRQQYLDCVRSLADGGEVDEDILFRVMDALDVSESQLSKDVATQQERFAAAEQVAHRTAAQSEVDRLTSEQNKLKAEHDKFMSAWQPKARVVQNALRAAELQVGALFDIERKLFETVLDPEILEKQADLERRRKELAIELREVQEDARQAENLISSARSGVEAAMQKVQATTREGYKHNSGEVARLESELSNERQAYDRTRARYQPLFQRFDELKRLRAMIDDEQQELNKLKLIP